MIVFALAEFVMFVRLVMLTAGGERTVCCQREFSLVWLLAIGVPTKTSWQMTREITPYYDAGGCYPRPSSRSCASWTMFRYS